MGCWEMTITRLNTQTGEVEAERVLEVGSVYDFIFSPVSPLLLAVGSDSVYFLDPITLEFFPVPLLDSRWEGDRMPATLNDAGTLLAVYRHEEEAYVIYGIPVN